MAEKKAKETKKEEVKLSKASADVMAAVEKMSVLELNELVKALEEKFGVSAAAIAAPAAAAPAGGEAPAEEAEEKSAYDVVLTGSGDQKIAVIKAVREINQNLGLAEAKALVDNPGKPIAEGVKKEEAEEAKKKLEAAGATVELK